MWWFAYHRDRATRSQRKIDSAEETHIERLPNSLAGTQVPRRNRSVSFGCCTCTGQHILNTCSISPDPFSTYVVLSSNQIWHCSWLSFRFSATLKPLAGYRLTYSGYDILALNVLQARGLISAVGSKIGMGKEADIYMAQTPDGDQVVLKLHRLGRTSFRAVKNKRDYVKTRTSVSWLYMSRLSALKEFAFMKALFQHGFRTPTPLDHNR